ncbi:MAG: polysaccharide export protein [Phyllobacteriaceae bacterium]|nr:polysaccharide export protein [Phyllobacteriaceae bacterium]
MRIPMQIMLVILGCTALAGCSSLPAQGPSASDVMSDAAPTDASGYEGYLVVDLDGRVADVLASRANATLVGRFGDHRPAPDTPIGIGDSVSVTIWEAAAGGLFSTPLSASGSPGSRSAVIPEQVVARDGSITVPYAGRLKVAGLATPVVEKRIVEALNGKAIEPQALVTVSKNISNTVTVTGEITTGARVPLSARGDRILDVIASTGGLRAPVHETFVSLSRGGRTATVPVQALLDRPAENIYVRPGDTLTLVRDPQTFTAFGATGRNAVVPFDARGITLEEAVAKSGGLLDYQSDPSAVFLLRTESAELARRLDPNRPIPVGRQVVDVVYRVDLRNTNSFFLARRVMVQNKDILYVANAPSTSIQKVLSVVQQAATPAVLAKTLTQ